MHFGFNIFLQFKGKATLLALFLPFSLNNWSSLTERRTPRPVPFLTSLTVRSFQASFGHFRRHCLLVRLIYFQAIKNRLIKVLVVLANECLQPIQQIWLTREPLVAQDFIEASPLSDIHAHQLFNNVLGFIGHCSPFRIRKIVNSLKQ